MEPVSIALICAGVFGTVLILAAFIRQIMISRDKQLNDQAQSKALSHEVNELEKMRVQMKNEKRFDSHYEVLGANKEAIMYIDVKIEEILRKKTELVERYGKITVKESDSIISGEASAERKVACDRLRQEIDHEIEFYNSELKQLQDRRGSLWDAHTDFQKGLLGQEKSRNDSLDAVYKMHSALLEKVYLRHIDDTEIVAVKGIESATTSFKDMIMAPIQFLMAYFGVVPAAGISIVHTQIENGARFQVDQAQRDINEPKHTQQKDAEDKNTKTQKPEVSHIAEQKDKDHAKPEKDEPSQEVKTSAPTCA